MSRLIVQTGIIFHVQIACLSLAFFIFADASHTRTAFANEGQLEKAITAYSEAMEESDSTQRRQSFELAEQLFRQVIEGNDESSGIRNSTLLTNLGNCALQTERLGPAIAAFRQAISLNPNDRKAIQNLEYARTLVPEWIQKDSETGFVDSFFFWLNNFSNHQISLVAACCFAAALLLLSFGVAQRKPILRNLAVLPALLWLVLMAGLAGKTWNADAHDLVVATETTLFSADSESSSPRVSKPLPGGAELRLLQERERWLEVSLPGNVTGWVLKSKTIQI